MHLIFFGESSLHLTLINAGMTLATILIYTGYFFRKSNNPLHRKLNTTAILLVVITAAYLLAGKYLMNGISAMNIYPIVPRWAVNVHRAFAAINLVMLLLMGYTGWKRNRELHKRIHHRITSLAA